MLTADVHRAVDLPEEAEAEWRALCAAEPAFLNPLLGPDFARAVAQAREDVRIAVFRRGGRTVGFLPYHLRPGRFARPIGAPFSDYHALVTAEAPGFTGPQALAAAGLAAYDATGLVDPFHLFAGSRRVSEDSFVMHRDVDAATFFEQLRSQHAKRFKNMRRLEAKLERERGLEALVAPDHDADALELILGWKRDQLVRTGLHDFLGVAWTRTLMTQLFQRREGDFQGLLLTLRVAGKPIAGHFGVRLGDQYHPWIASFDPEWSAWSPGQLFLGQAVKALDELGLRTYHLSPGHGHYKRPFATTMVPLHGGLATADSAHGRWARGAERSWEIAGRLAPARGPALVSRVQRRLQHISSVELTMLGRVKGLAQAASASGRRSPMADEGAADGE